MSATNRGATRRPQDLYATPIRTIESILDRIDWAWVRDVLEPAAGDGRIITRIRKRQPQIPIKGIDIRTGCCPEYILSLILAGIENPLDPAPLRHREENPAYPFVQDETDYLTNPFTADLIITNPPFSLAQEFITKAVQEAPTVVMLQRLNFLGSRKRREWWQDHTPSHLYVLSERPKFTNNRTDATEYAWFVWDRSTYGPMLDHPGIYII